MTGTEPAAVEARVRGVLAEVLEVPESAIGEGFAREQAASWDSLTHLRLVAVLEEELGVRFAMAALPELTSYRAILAAVQQGG